MAEAPTFQQLAVEKNLTTQMGNPEAAILIKSEARAGWRPKDLA